MKGQKGKRDKTLPTWSLHSRVLVVCACGGALNKKIIKIYSMSDSMSKHYAKYAAEEKKVGSAGGVVVVIINIVIRKSLSENLKIEQRTARSKGVSYVIIERQMHEQRLRGIIMLCVLEDKQGH